MRNPDVPGHDPDVPGHDIRSVCSSLQKKEANCVLLSVAWVFCANDFLKGPLNNRWLQLEAKYSSAQTRLKLMFANLKKERNFLQGKKKITDTENKVLDPLVISRL